MYTYYKVMIADVSDAFTYLKIYLDKEQTLIFYKDTLIKIQTILILYI